jgi:hypothetical protein
MHHHSSQEGFQKAALEGCRICGALWRKLSISEPALIIGQIRQ